MESRAAEPVEEATSPRVARAWALRPWVALAMVFALALFARLIYLLQFRHAPFFDLLQGDAEAYDAWARQIAAGDWMGKEIFYQAPLYPYFLGLWYKLAGTGFWSLRLVQITLGAMSCVFLAIAGVRFFSPLVGLVAGVMLALYPPAIFSDALVQKTVLDGFFLTLGLMILSELSLRPNRFWNWMALGVVFACLALTRENALVLPVLIIAWPFIFLRDQTWQRRTLWATAMLLGLFIGLAPVAWRNHHVGGEWTITTAQLGPNLFIGNGPDATGRYVPLLAGHGHPSYERRDATTIAERAMRRSLSPGEVSSFWTTRALDYIEAHPGRWLGLMGRKLWMTWNAYEFSDTDDQYFSARYSWLLRGLGAVFHFGVVVPLGIAGIVLTWRERRRLWVLYLLLVGYSLSVAMFYVFARYRYPLAPMMILFAAAGIVEIARRLRRRDYRGVVAPLIAACVVAIVVNWPPATRNDIATALHNIGVTMLKQNKPDEAAKFSELALQEDPKHFGAHNTLGRVLAGKGDLPGALREFQLALERGSESADVRTNLGNALVSLGRASEAADEYRRAIQIDPASAEAYNGLGVALVNLGQYREAAAAFQRSSALKPDYPDPQRNYQKLLRIYQQHQQQQRQQDPLDLRPRR